MSSNQKNAAASGRSASISGFREWADKVETYWNEHPLGRAWGAWTGVIVFFVLLALIPVELEIGGQIYRYVGTEASADEQHIWVLETADGTQYQQGADGNLTAQELQLLDTFARRSMQRGRRLARICAIWGVGLLPPFCLAQRKRVLASMLCGREPRPREVSFFQAILWGIILVLLVGLCIIVV